jgi:hypothetical protein
VEGCLEFELSHWVKKQPELGLVDFAYGKGIVSNCYYRKLKTLTVTIFCLAFVDGMKHTHSTLKHRNET